MPDDSKQSSNKSNDKKATQSGSPKSASGAGGKPPPNPPKGDLSPEDFAEFLLQLLTTPELQNYGKDGNVVDGRKALGEIISTIVETPMKKGLEPHVFWLGRIFQTLRTLTGSLEKLPSLAENTVVMRGMLNQLHEDRFRLGRLNNREAQDRFELEYPQEKRAIAEYVAAEYFREPIQCFIQASTTARHLVEVMHQAGWKPGTVVHTNSFALPYLLLATPKRIRVHAVCGGIHDWKCDGWLYAADDKETESRVRGLFDKERGPSAAQTAFLTPQVVDAEANGYFAKEETVHLIETILDSAQKVVVLTPGPRIYASADALPDQQSVSWHKIALRRGNPKQSWRWIIGGELRQLNVDGKASFDKVCREQEFEVKPL